MKAWGVGVHAPCRAAMSRGALQKSTHSDICTGIIMNALLQAFKFRMQTRYYTRRNLNTTLSQLCLNCGRHCTAVRKKPLDQQSHVSGGSVDNRVIGDMPMAKHSRPRCKQEILLSSKNAMSSTLYSLSPEHSGDSCEVTRSFREPICSWIPRLAFVTRM